MLRTTEDTARRTRARGCSRAKPCGDALLAHPQPVQKGDFPTLLSRVQAYIAARRDREPACVELFHDWCWFYETYNPVVVDAVRGLHLPALPLDDRVQEAWRAIWCKLPHLEYQRELGPFCAWLVTVARNAAITLARYEGRHSLEEAVGDLEPWEELPDPADGPATAYEHGELAEHVRGWLRDLEARGAGWVTNAQILELRWLEGWSLSQIAAYLSMSIDRVCVRHFRALRALADLAQYDDLEPSDIDNP